MLRLIVLLLWLGLVSCSETFKQPKALAEPRPFFLLDSLSRTSLREWQGGRPDAVSLPGWHFVLGAPTETLLADSLPDFTTAQAVSLPHRLLVPNQAIWYQSALYLADSMLLHINADDGAQVFLEGQQLMQESPNLYVLPPTKDTILLQIRVLNNALAGGLRAADRYALEQGRTYFRRQDPAVFCLEEKVPWDNSWASPRLLATPYWQRDDEGKLLLRLLSNQAATALLHYGYSPSRLNLRISAHSTPQGVASFHFPELEEQPTDYIYYQLQLGDQRTALDSFRLAPRDMRFTAWGDSQGGWNTFHTLAKSMAKRQPAFSIGLGDLVANGSSRTQWSDFLAAQSPLGRQTTMYMVAGNHDYDGYYDDLHPTLYQQYWRRPTYYAWSYGKLAFIALDPNQHFPLQIGSPQKEWLAKQFQKQAWKQAEWRFLLVHQPPYSQGWPGYAGDEFMRSLLDTYAEEAAIDFVLSGHSHCYERLSLVFGQQTTHCLVLGGAGGGLEPPASNPLPTMDTLIKAHHYADFSLTADGHIQLQIIGLQDSLLEEVLFCK